MEASHSEEDGGSGQAAAEDRRVITDVAREIEKALDDGQIGWHQVLQLGTWNLLKSTEDTDRHDIAKRYYLRALEVFRAQHGGAEIAIFGGIRGGVFLLKDGQLHMTVTGAMVRFDWSDAWKLVFEIDAFAEEAKEWWQIRSTGSPEDNADPASHPPQKPRFWSRIWAMLNRVPDLERAAAQRRPHSNCAYSLATWVIGAIAQESEKHPEPEGSTLPEPSRNFQARLANFGLEVRAARVRFREAAQRSAQSRYWQGMLVGGLGVAACCLLLGTVFWWRGVDAYYGVAIPAGALGAMVSVLQRMTSGKLVLDIDAGRDLIEVFGAVRPFIGAIFGLVVMALLLGGLIPAVDIPGDQELAFFAGLGFFAGFNERWAQDMLKGGASSVGVGAARGVESVPD